MSTALTQVTAAQFRHRQDCTGPDGLDVYEGASGDVLVSCPNCRTVVPRHVLNRAIRQAK